MADKVLASTLIAPKQFEVREYPMPEIGPDAGLLKVEACGVCGSDVHQQTRMLGTAHILGHENVGTIVKLGSEAGRKWGLEEGDRVCLEEYMPCGRCELCRSGDYRFCKQTDPMQGASAMFYGTTPVDVAPSLWGGYSQYMYLHPNAVMHKLPADLPVHEAVLFLSLSNGIEWMYRYGEVKLGDTVVIQGPGQMGLSAVVTAKEAGASKIIVSGLTHDAERLALAKRFGATDTIDVQTEDFKEKVMDITNGKGVNVVVNVSGAGKSTVQEAISVAGHRCNIVLAAPGDETVRVAGWGRKRIALKAANGHCYDSIEDAINLIASHKYPLHEMCTHTFGLEDAGLAIKTVAGDGVPGGIHVSILPWSE